MLLLEGKETRYSFICNVKSQSDCMQVRIQSVEEISWKLLFYDWLEVQSGIMSVIVEL